MGADMSMAWAAAWAEVPTKEQLRRAQSVVAAAAKEELTNPRLRLPKPDTLELQRLEVQQKKP